MKPSKLSVTVQQDSGNNQVDSRRTRNRLSVWCRLSDNVSVRRIPCKEPNR
jgi:hypothetical protein